MRGRAVDRQNEVMTDSAHRMLLVHAHPDDESIGNGATMAMYVDQGAQVTLITCTRGEEGEILIPELAHLAADQDDQLGQHRVGELAAAMRHLGVTDHRFLDETQGFEPVQYRDSGMSYGPNGEVIAYAGQRDDAFAAVPVDQAAERLAAVIREVRPQVVITYEPGGGYGHPDHVQAHRVTMRAVELAVADGVGGPGWQIPKVYWNVAPREAMVAMLESAAEAGEDTPFERWSPESLPSMFVPAERVTTYIDGSAFVEQKKNALREHATQVDVEGPFFALSNSVGQPVMAMESYQLVGGTVSPPEQGWEHDLFEGIEA